MSGQLVTSYQTHGGFVITSTSPKVQYGFENGSDATIRITGVTYPDGRNVVDDYGIQNGINDAASRIFSMKTEGESTNLVQYQYLGRSGFVNTNYPTAAIDYTMIGTGNDPDTGDILPGPRRWRYAAGMRNPASQPRHSVANVEYDFDRFGRVKNAICKHSSATKARHNRSSSQSCRASGGRWAAFRGLSSPAEVVPALRADEQDEHFFSTQKSPAVKAWHSVQNEPPHSPDEPEVNACHVG